MTDDQHPSGKFMTACICRLNLHEVQGLSSDLADSHKQIIHACQLREKFSRDKLRPVDRSEAGFGRGVRGSSPEIKKKLLQMVQSELFLSYICQYN